MEFFILYIFNILMQFASSKLWFVFWLFSVVIWFNKSRGAREIFLPFLTLSFAVYIFFFCLCSGVHNYFHLTSFIILMIIWMKDHSIYVFEFKMSCTVIEEILVCWVSNWSDMEYCLCPRLIRYLQTFTKLLQVLI